MENQEINKSNPFTIAKSVDYQSGSVMNRTILNRITGTINILAFTAGETTPSKIYPFDAFIQIIDGQAEITIDEKLVMISSGESIIIPAKSRVSIVANKNFKMQSTVIKTAY